MTLVGKGGKSERRKVASPESVRVPVHPYVNCVHLEKIITQKKR